MVVISKREKEIILEKYPEVHIVRTMRQRSKRHRYYCEETKRVMRLLNTLRNPKPDKKEVSGYSDRQKRKRVGAAVS